MLHSCSYPGCDTRTLSTYCLEHEVVVEAGQACDEPLSADLAEAASPGLSAG